MHWIYLSFACTLSFSFSYSLGLSAWTPKEQPQTPWNATKRFKTRLYRHQNGKQNEIVAITEAQQWLYLNFTKWRSNCLQKRIWCEIRWRLLLTLSNLSMWFGAIHAPSMYTMIQWICFDYSNEFSTIYTCSHLLFVRVFRKALWYSAFSEKESKRKVHFDGQTDSRRIDCSPWSWSRRFWWWTSCHRLPIKNKMHSQYLNERTREMCA